MADHVLGLSRSDRVVVLGGFPLLGGLIGWALPAVARWVLQLRWAPFGGPLRLVERLDGGWGLAGAVACGALLGAAIGFIAVHEALRVIVGDEGLVVEKGDSRRTVAKSDVDAVFVEGRQLVVLDRESRQVVRDRLENAERPRVRKAFAAHGYPWVDEDPYDGLFRRWVPDLPDLPGSVNALLAARAKALEGGGGADAAELRDEVQKLGYTVRDGDKVQYWRPLVKP
ncbi:YqeB family protein [Dactylosporangium sp. CA-139066]|uniref:YqeB family protein n=1 Tax=Dactylosporangium sp. CA-139066 TaxID=3239930 RepID=UPI003D8A7B20